MKFDQHFFDKAKRRLFRYIYLYTGINLSITAVSFSNYFVLKKQLRLFKKQGIKSSVSFPVTWCLFPCYEDKRDNAGSLGFHYFYQDLYMAQRIYQNNPVRHIDIGSNISGFVAHVASYREIEVYDIRPLNSPIHNVKFKQFDLMQFREEDIESTDSISCLHALEHFGLGRYGDPICYDGYLIGFQNIYKILKTNGKFYFSIPFGKQRVEFHAHRVFSLKYLLELIAPYYSINSFSYIDDNNVFYENVIISEEKIANNCGCRFGCAIFELTKI
ncbi:MAG: DUF268 domain-containing protein [Candidatus Azobacteroides sp.]|nr:DUF268 domain-containing protein [Candidatus Azobacteroides sp.]